jgi:hypothetical protein
MKFYTDWPGPSASVRVGLEPKDYEEGWGEIPGYADHKEQQMLGTVPDAGGHLKVIQGSRMRDLIQGVEPWMFFLTERAVTVFQEYQFTGCRFVRYTVEGLPNGESVLYRLIVTGRCGAIVSAYDLDRQRKLISIDTSSTKFLNIDTWDGSDFFVPQPRKGGWYFTKRVAKTIKEHKLAFGTKELLWTDRTAFDALFER